MFSGLLITLREGIEAALIIGIVLAYLTKTNNFYLKKYIWYGAYAAILFSLVFGFFVSFVFSGLEGRAEEIFEGLTMLLAVLVLTYMLIWMKKQSSTIKKELEKKVNNALILGSGTTLFLLSFTAIAREGFETVLFLFSAINASSISNVLIGGFVGLSLAILIGVIVYKGSKRINLKTFFNITGLALIFFAAGLLANGIHELQEALLLPIYNEQLWNINWILDEKSFVGSFMKSIFGYNSNPSLMETIAYFLYLPIVLIYFFKTPLIKNLSKEVPRIPQRNTS